MLKKTSCILSNFQNKEQIREQLKLYIQRFSFINPAVEFDHTAIAVDDTCPTTSRHST